jgi:dienelactone hydrolase
MRVVFTIFVVLIALPAFAQNKKEPKMLPGDEAINAYLKKRTEEISKNFMAGAKTKAEWEKLRSKLKEQYLDMLGLWPLPDKTPLNPMVTGTVDTGSVIIERLHFQSKPGLYVTGNLYRPKKVEGKLPTILYVCGHSGKGRDGNKTAFQDHGMWFASNGYVCLVIDTLQLGEVAGKHHGTYNLNRFWWQSLGYTPAGVECWNGVRAIDYLITRKDVDPERIGVTGISGGGAATFWIAGADERVKVAVPVSGMSDLESYVTNKVINGHCDCMFLVNTYQWEWTTIAALIAPRPMLFANSDKDSIFPMDGNRRIINRLRDCYKMLGAPDLVDEYVSVGGHDYRPDLRVAIFKFINKHLKKDTGEVKDADFKALAGKELRVFPEDSDLPKDELNSKIDETFVTAKRPKLPEAKEFEEWKNKLIKELREQSLLTLPPKVDEAKELKSLSGVCEDLSSEDGTRFFGMAMFLHPDRAKNLTLLVLNPDENPYKVSQSQVWDKRLEDCAFCYSISPRGGVNNEWTRGKPPNYVERAHPLLGTTVDTTRLRDILAMSKMYSNQIEKAKKDIKPKFRIAGSGQAGILAVYAALLEPGISEVVIIDPPTSHRDGPHFLNVMRVLDIPDALGLLAPRPLTIVGGKDKAFDRTAEIYKLAGAADKLKRLEK